MSDRHEYLRDGTAIYERSFAIIRAETDLSRFSEDEADIVVRMVHACGSTDAARHIQFGGGLVRDSCEKPFIMADRPMEMNYPKEKPYFISNASNSSCAIDFTPGSVSLSAFSINGRPSAAFFPIRVSPIMAFCLTTGYESCKPRR